MNKVVLLLNTLIMLVVFVLALTTTNVQAGLSQTAARLGTTSAVRQSRPAVAYVRLIGSLEGKLPQTQLDKLHATQARAVYDAMIHYQWLMESGVDAILRGGEGGRPLMRQLATLGRNAKEEIEQQLRDAVGDEALVRQLATAIYRHAP